MSFGISYQGRDIVRTQQSSGEDPRWGETIGKYNQHLKEKQNISNTNGNSAIALEESTICSR